MCKRGQVVPRIVQNVAAEVLQTKDGLPDPSSPLSESMPSSSIEEANKEVIMSAQLALVDDDNTLFHQRNANFEGQHSERVEDDLLV